MAGWTKHTGTAVLLARDNIDTDQLIPARFMSVPRSEGYGEYLLYDVRRDATGQPERDFPLNRVKGVSVLVAGQNFGSGSSREAAVYALVDAGIRAVIAPGFGDIFAGNAVNNGLLPAQVTPDDWQALRNALSDAPRDLSIDLATLCIQGGDNTIPFQLSENWRTKLIHGWDDIDLTLHHADDIARHRRALHERQPWVFPAPDA